MTRAEGPAKGLAVKVLELRARGLSSRQIADTLRADGHKISFATVARMLRESREERRELATEIVREKLVRTVGSDLDLLTKHLDALDHMATDLRDTDRKFYLAVVDKMAKLVDLRLHYSGADAPAPEDDALRAAATRVREKWARLRDDAGRA